MYIIAGVCNEKKKTSCLHRIQISNARIHYPVIIITSKIERTRSRQASNRAKAFMEQLV